MKTNKLIKGMTIASAAVAAMGMSAYAEDVYQVGICQLVQHVALDAATEGFQDALVDAFGEDGVEFNLQNAAGDSTNCATITNSFVSDGVDLIMANATPALQSAAAATADIPILGTSVTDYATALDIDDWSGTVGGNISGTSDLAPLDQQAALFPEVLPDAQNIGVIYCSAEQNSEYQATTITGYLEELGLTVTSYTFADSNDIASVVTTACAENDALYIPTDNTAASCTELIRNVAEPAGTPIIVGEEGICSGCGIATLSISYYDLGYTTGEMAAKILSGEADVAEMPVEFAPNVVKKYNAEICESLGIEIPEGFEAIETAEE